MIHTQYTQHRDEYFPQNLAEFLAHSTLNQLQNYIANYKQPIRNSIKEAQKLSTRSQPIYQFPGFHKLIQPHRASQTTVNTTSVRNARNNTKNPHQNPNPPSPLSPVRSYIQTTIREWKAATYNAISKHKKREKPPHKHTRWKPFDKAQTSLRAFFHHTTQNSNQTPNQHLFD